ncbi:MAG: hypothetical protein JKX70_06540 [Phycisphaerales bacterium]|nr:hypothetical protein [Phycisphaerales bacterium]
MTHHGNQSNHSTQACSSTIDGRFPVSSLLEHGSNTAILTPDSNQLQSDPWSTSQSQNESDYSKALFANTPWCARGDDLDDDEAYFLEDDDDNDDTDDEDEDLDDDYDDDDEDDGEPDEDSDEEDDDEEL